MRLLTGSARLAGVIGWPVAHSRSPKIHGSWLSRYGIDGAYVPLAVRPGDFAVAVRGLAAAGFAGVNVTLPHKEAAFALADECDAAAAACGAVNTLVFAQGRILGRNTDGYGFVANLHNHNARFWHVPALILGAGGAARAIAAALQAEGNPVTICNRTADRSKALADQVGADILPWEDRAAELGKFGLLVNTTSLGLTNHPALDISLDRAQPQLVVADIVYNPLRTKLLLDAHAKGLHAVEGLGMLLHQAVPGFEAWFGVKPEVDAALYALAKEGL